MRLTLDKGALRLFQKLPRSKEEDHQGMDDQKWTYGSRRGRGPRPVGRRRSCGHRYVTSHIQGERPNGFTGLSSIARNIFFLPSYQDSLNMVGLSFH